jgi:hypothetical protein
VGVTSHRIWREGGYPGRTFKLAAWSKVPEKLLVTRLVNKLTEIALPRSQLPVIGPYPEPDESSQQNSIDNLHKCNNMTAYKYSAYFQHVNTIIYQLLRFAYLFFYLIILCRGNSLYDIE